MQALFDQLSVYVARIVDTHERDLVEHRYPLVDGAEQEDLGAAPYEASLQVGFLGEGWDVEYAALRSLMDRAAPITFQHPRTFDIYQVRIKRIRPEHSTALQNGVLVNVDIVEDTATAVGLTVTVSGAAGAAASFDDAASSASSALGVL